MEESPALRKDLEGRIAALPCWRGAVRLEPLLGGLTNLSWVATDGGERFVVRCGADIPVHHVFRDRERAVAEAAFAAGLSPRLVHAEPGLAVLRYVDGRTLVEADLATNLDRIVPLLRRCHRELGRHVRGAANAFWVFHVIRDYVARIDEDPRYLDVADRLEAAQIALPIVFGHHDLLPGNFLDDGQRLWLIDWEYAGFGTALFDLANLSSNGGFDPAHDAALLAAYFGDPPTPALRRAFDAMKVASALREALWSRVSEVHLRTPGVDYQAHARDYFSRFEAALGAFERTQS